MDSKENFSLYSRYYDLLYRDKDYVAEAKYIVDLIKDYAPNAHSILELGSGTGKHARLFEQEGYQILGIERSREMVEIALKHPKPNISYQIADISKFYSDQKFDVALSLFHVISYLTTNDELIETFKNVYKHLVSDGLFIFDVWHTPAVHHQKPENRTKKFKSDDIEVNRTATPDINDEKNLVVVNYKISVTDLKTELTETFEEQHPMRHFGFLEIELLAKLTGFEVVKSEEFLTKNMPSSQTWGVSYLLKKKD